MSIHKSQQPGLASLALPEAAEQSLINTFWELAFKSKQMVVGSRKCAVVFGSETSEEDRGRMVAALEAKGYVVKHSVQAPQRKRFTPPARPGRLTKKQAGFGPRNRWGELA